MTDREDRGRMECAVGSGEMVRNIRYPEWLLLQFHLVKIKDGVDVTLKTGTIHFYVAGS